MLQFIKELGNKLLEFIKDDPVRPEIPTDFRVSDGRMVAALVEDNKPDAMVCVSFHDFVPESVENLKQTTQDLLLPYSIRSGATRQAKDKNSYRKRLGEYDYNIPVLLGS